MVLIVLNNADVSVLRFESSGKVIICIVLDWQVSTCCDVSQFDKHVPDKDDTPDDTTGWDSEF